MADQCVFCRIVRGEIPAQLLANTADCIAFRDLNPQAPVHILIVPKKHIGSLDDLTEPDIPGKMTMLAIALARQEGIATSGYRIVLNNGADGGQSVFHLHLHLLGGRQMAWPPG
jgi:histidine triad (HIT) family protein